MRVRVDGEIYPITDAPGASSNAPALDENKNIQLKSL